MKNFANSELFLNRLKLLIEDHANGKYTVFARKVGVPAGTFYNIMQGQIPNAEHLISISEFCEVSIDWLLTGKRSPYRKEDDSPSIESLPTPPKTTEHVVERQHMELVRMFYDKPRANSAVMDLLEIERLNRESFIEVVGFIKGVAINLKVDSDHKGYKDLDRRKAQRRVANNNGDIPGGIERRSGKDRRKAVGGDR